MFCDACGARLNDNQKFCSACGKPVGGVPMMPQESRIAGHVRLLGILWIALSAFRLIPALFLLIMGTAVFPHLAGVPLFIRPLFGLVAMGMGGMALLGLFAGWGLLERRLWARTLALVLGCISLLEMPFGTALGIYTLWVLLPAGSDEEYRRLARVA